MWVEVHLTISLCARIVKEIRSRKSLFVVGVCHSPRKKGRATMMIGDIDILRLMVMCSKVRKRSGETRKSLEIRKERVSEFGQQKGGVNHSSFHK